MRMLFMFILMIVFTGLKAQTIYPELQTNIYNNSLLGNHHLYDSSSLQKKWFVSRYIGVTAGYSFFKGGHASIIAAPLNLQLNRRLNNNLYAYAGVSVTPAYISFSNAFVNTNVNKLNTNNNFLKNRSLGINPGASVGLMYVNDAKTFSISSGISIERDNYPVYYYSPNTNQSNTALPVHR